MTSKFTKAITIPAILVLLVILTSSSGVARKKPEVKNIILLIGDGMGLAQVYSAMSVTDHPLNIERAKYIGLSKTYSANNYITDSGAGGTAISTGTKTNNGAIAVDTQGKKLKTILEYAEDYGKATGIVVTCNLNHATPASFIAHENLRYMDVDITRDFLKTDIDVLIGGGAHIFDSLKVSDQMQKKGYQLTYSIDSIDSRKAGNLLCLAAEDQLPPMLNGRSDYLPKSVNIALDRLSKNQSGFFLMVEGSQIDWGGHSNNIDYVTSELLDFDKAVGEAMDFADKNPGTLVIITADHETGGLTLTDGNVQERKITAQFSTTYHSGVMVPIYTYGTGSEAFSGIMQNTDIFCHMMKAFGFTK
jgi:alkaline phosphatase